MGIVLEWEPWNSDLWNTPQEPDDDDASLVLLRQNLDEAMKAGCDSDKTLADKPQRLNS